MLFYERVNATDSSPVSETEKCTGKILDDFDVKLCTFNLFWNI